MSGKPILKTLLLSGWMTLLCVSIDSALVSAEDAASPGNRPDERSSRVPQPAERPAQNGAAHLPGWLGIILDMNPDRRDPPGARIIHVFHDSPAERAGLRLGDLVIELNGQDITTARQLVDELRSLEAGATIEISVDRDGSLWGISTVLADRSLLYRSDQSRNSPLLESDRLHHASEVDHVGAYRQLDERLRHTEKAVQRMRDDINSLRKELEDLKNRIKSDSNRATEPTSGAIIES